MNKRHSKKEPKGEAGSILVLYENRTARERAVSFCEELIARFETGQLETHWCSFEALKNADKAAKAVADGGAADWVVFTVSGAGEFPDDIKLWTERWLAKRDEREGTLVGLISDGKSNPCDVACLKEVYLRHLANRAGMDYLSKLPQIISTATGNLSQSLDQRAGQVTTVLNEILHKHFVPPNVPLR
jgi:hypothetical protein